ncbi:MAG: hypothetical protein ACKO9S_04175 [Bacteroidota bacterium]
MKIITLIKRLLQPKELSWEEKSERLFRKMGYHQLENGMWQSINGNCRTMITLMNGGVHIKVYGYGYGESDFLPGPVEDMEKLKRFIRSNEV